MNFVDNMEDALISFGKQLFRDERNAAVFSMTITALVYLAIYLIWGKDAPQLLFVIVLPLAAPVFEKPFLFLAYFLQAKQMWEKVNQEMYENFLEKQDDPIVFPQKFVRGDIYSMSGYKKYSECLSQVFREEDAWRILKADIMYHDTLSWLFMVIATTFFVPNIDTSIDLFIILTTGEGVKEILLTGLLGAVCFVLAVMGAAVLEVKVTDLMFKRFQKKLVEKFGFGEPEVYYELLYVLFGKEPDLRIFDEVKDEYNLGDKGISHHTEYEVVTHKLGKYNNWRGSIQIRQSTWSGNSLQVIFEEPFPIKTKNTDAFRCFAVKKMKWKKSITGEKIEDVFEELSFIDSDTNVVPVNYNRTFTYNPDSLSISVDCLSEKQMCWFEVKMWPEKGFKKVFRKLNDLIMFETSARPLTKRKSVTLQALLKARQEKKITPKAEVLIVGSGAGQREQLLIDALRSCEDHKIHVVPFDTDCGGLESIKLRETEFVAEKFDMDDFLEAMRIEGIQKRDRKSRETKKYRRDLLKKGNRMKNTGRR